MASQAEPKSLVFATAPKLSGTPVTPTPCVTTRPTPCRIVRLASVMMIGDSLTRQTAIPFASPTAPPNASAATTAAAGGMDFAQIAARTAVTAKSDPIERSMLPAIIRKVVPSAAMPVYATWSAITWKLSSVRKSARWTLTTTIAIASASRSPALRALRRAIHATRRRTRASATTGALVVTRSRARASSRRCASRPRRPSSRPSAHRARSGRGS
jgi:hypothetical protein